MIIRRKTKDERRKSVILTLKGEGSRNGFTLMELLVYMMIVGIIVIIAGQAFTDSTKFRIRTQNMVRATQEAENIASLFKADVAQMGAKSSMQSRGANGEDDIFSGVMKIVYMDTINGDSSSFRFSPSIPAKGQNLDTITFRRMRYSSTGTYEAVEEVQWFLANHILRRQCLILDKVTGASDENCAPKGTDYDAMAEYAVEMATDVDTFHVLPAKPSVSLNGIGATTQIFPPAGESFRLVARFDGELYKSPNVPADGGESVTIGNFANNYRPDGTVPDDKEKNELYAFPNTGLNGDWQALCSNNAEGHHFTFVPKQEYELSFKLEYNGDNSRMFVPGKDHMAVGFRNSEGKKISGMDDYMFYPPTATAGDNLKRATRFTVQDTVKGACIAFTFSMFSPLASQGKITIESLKLEKIASSGYVFDENVTNVPLVDKKNVKALKLDLEISRGKKKDGKGETGKVEIVIPTPSNGPRD